MISQTSLSQRHTVVCGDSNFFNRVISPIKCVYIIDGIYIGSTNDLKRRIREYIGRAKRNEPVRSDTPIMRHIKKQLSNGETIRFFILHEQPCREFVFINRYLKRGVKLLNVCLSYSYSESEQRGRGGFFERYKEVSYKTCGRVALRKK